MEQGGSSTVQALLLQEAQQEISSLRTDLYAQRRVAEERRQALQAVTLERDTFKEQVHSLTAQLSELQSQLHQLRGLEVQYADLQRSSSKQQQELELSLKARRILEQELAGERRQRESLSEAKAGLEAERSRLQKARDDLTASLRVAQKKAADAEEEQMRAEEEAAALRAELQALQAAHGSPSMSASGYGAGSMPFGADGSVPAAEARHLQEQIEYERSRASALLTSLHEAKAQVLALQQQQQLDAQQHGYEEDAHLQRQVAQLSSSLAQANAQVTRLQSELQHQRELSEHLHSQLQQQQQQWQQQQQQQEGASAVQGVTNGHASHHSNHRQQFEGVNGVAQQGHTTSAIHPRHQHTHSAAPSDAMSTEQASEELDRLHAQVRDNRAWVLQQLL
jgi:DNA repair exonuclease SbcCD ATPase subunit